MGAEFLREKLSAQGIGEILALDSIRAFFLCRSSGKVEFCIPSGSKKTEGIISTEFIYRESVSSSARREAVYIFLIVGCRESVDPAEPGNGKVGPYFRSGIAVNREWVLVAVTTAEARGIYIQGDGEFLVRIERSFRAGHLEKKKRVAFRFLDNDGNWLGAVHRYTH